MIRVLHYGLSDSVGGIERYLKSLYSGINKDKYIFDFIILGEKKTGVL